MLCPVVVLVESVDSVSSLVCVASWLLVSEPVSEVASELSLAGVLLVVFVVLVVLVVLVVSVPLVDEDVVASCLVPSSVLVLSPSALVLSS